jgi:hypothetical protein
MVAAFYNSISSSLAIFTGPSVACGLAPVYYILLHWNVYIKYGSGLHP